MWVDQYAHGEKIRDIASNSGVAVSTVYSAFRRAGLPCNRLHRNEKINREFLLGPVTNKLAYLGGLLMADGYLGTQSVVLKLHEKDNELLQTLADLCYQDGRKVSQEPGVAIFRLASVEVVERLRNLLRKKKTNAIRLPIVFANSFFYEFLRGVFDGDGTVSVREDRPHQTQVSVCSTSRMFLEDLRQRLLLDNIAPRIYTENRRGKVYRVPQGVSRCCEDMHRLVFSTHEARIRLFEKLYPKHCQLKLYRKYTRFKVYYDNAVKRAKLKPLPLTDKFVDALYAKLLESGASIRSLERRHGLSNCRLYRALRDRGYLESLRNA